MQIAPLRDEEDSALDALRGLCVLDSPEEAQFNALAETAALVCGTPICAISLIDVHRQWFKACVGLPGVTETSRDAAFCAHAVLGNELMEVPNALDDERFHDNPLVIGDPHIRFYAGMPLRLKNGICIGTLCVIDRVPRVLSDLQREVLHKLAVAVTSALQDRRAAQQVQELSEQNRRLYESSPALMYSVDRNGYLVAVSDMCLAKLGYAREEVAGRRGMEFLTPASRDKAQSHVLPKLMRDGHYEGVEYQVQTKSGEVLDVVVSARMEFDSGGRPVRSLSVMEDVTQRKKIERTLSVVLDAVPSLIAHWDPDLRCTIANAAFSALFSPDLTTIRGRDLATVLGASAFSVHEPYLLKALGGGSCSFEWHPSSSEMDSARHWMVHYLPDKVDGEIRGVYVLMHDVSELVQTRTDLMAAQRQSQSQSQSQEILGVLQDHAIVSITDRRGSIVEVNENFCHIAGYGREELIGQNHRLVNSGTHGPGFWKTMWTTVAGGRAWRGEMCNRAKDGSLYWVDSIIAPLKDANGRIERYISIRHDITQRKQASFQLEASFYRVDVACEAAGIGMWVYDTQTGKLDWDERMCRLFGGSLADGLRPIDYLQKALHPDDKGNVWAALTGDSEAIPLQQFGFRIFRHGDELHHLYAFSRHVRSRDGQAQLIIGACMDQTQSTLQAQKLQDALTMAEQAALAKSQFLANISHELRTPMNAVIGLGYLLQKTSLNADQKGLVDKIDSAGKSLLAIINDILDVTRIEAGEMQIEPHPFAIADVISQLRSMIQVLADEKGLEFRCNVDDYIPTYVLGDATRVHQILLNLLFNAVKFTEAGYIGLDIRAIKHESDSWLLRFEVQDTGIGIDPKVVPKLFAPFTQADASTTRRFGGSGLGLSIVKQLAQLMGGNVGVVSSLHKGSVFWLELPFKDSAPAPSVLSSDPLITQQNDLLRNVRVLAVDDSVVNLEVLRRVLEIEGSEVTVAMNGQEALDLLRSRPGDFDVVLMDAQMPALDGYETTKSIRSELGLMNLPVVALTAGTLSSEQARARDAGMNDFLAKPYEPDKIIACIRKHVGLTSDQLSDTSPCPVKQPFGSDWPEIQGIDSSDAQRRLSGEVDLFLQMLRRLLNDFLDIRELSDQLVPAQMGNLQARMHTLKGNASTLGAKELAQVAAHAESVLRSKPDTEQVIAALQAVKLSLVKLAASFDALALPTDVGPPLPTHDAPALKPADLWTLVTLLEQGNMDAFDLYPTLRDALGAQMSTEASKHLQHCMSELRFAEAAKQLRTSFAGLIVQVH